MPVMKIHSGRSGFMTDWLEAQATEWSDYREKYTGTESVSGPGSTLEFTAPLRDWLPIVIEKYFITSVLDAPCGDGNWMSHVDLRGASYTGWDVDAEVIRSNRMNGNAPDPWGSKRFQCVNMLTVSEFPKVDLIICRDWFIHIPDEHVVLVLNRMRASGSKFLCATNFPYDDNVVDTPYDEDGFFYRPTNLENEPFNLSEPWAMVAEPGREPGREMALFRL